jgi:hypothetical protein
MTGMRLRIALLAANLGGCALIPTPHIIGDVEFAGCVHDRVTGAPVSGASIVVAYPATFSSSMYQYVGAIKSDPQGCFHFIPAPERSMQPMRGPITVRIYANGYQTALLSLGEVAGKMNLKVNLQDIRLRH